MTNSLGCENDLRRTLRCWQVGHWELDKEITNINFNFLKNLLPEVRTIPLLLRRFVITLKISFLLTGCHTFLLKSVLRTLIADGVKE